MAAQSLPEILGQLLGLFRGSLDRNLEVDKIKWQSHLHQLKVNPNNVKKTTSLNKCEPLLRFTMRNNKELRTRDVFLFVTDLYFPWYWRNQVWKPSKRVCFLHTFTQLPIWVSEIRCLMKSCHKSDTLSIKFEDKMARWDQGLGISGWLSGSSSEQRLLKPKFILKKPTPRQQTQAMSIFQDPEVLRTRWCRGWLF